MEKDHAPDSMATVNIKPEYPPSEVYSSASEPPPAYKMRSSNSVQIARIVAITVVTSSFILGCFILASSYLSARASCEQLQQLDAVLEKELMLEARHMQPEALVQDEPLPQAEHLQSSATNHHLGKNPSRLPDEGKLQSLAGDTPEHDEPRRSNSDESDDSSGSDDSYSPDSEDSDEETHTVQFKLPLELNFDELAGALMEKNQRSRMNCIVEKRRAEEVVDQQPRSVRLPFGVNLTTDPKYQRVTGERMAIFCESGHETRSGDEPMSHPIVLPIHLTAPQPQQPQQMPQPAQQMQAPVSPATRFFPLHMPPQLHQQMMPPQMPPQMSPQQQHMVPQHMLPQHMRPQEMRPQEMRPQDMRRPDMRPEMRPDMQSQEMAAQMGPQIRVHVQRIAIPSEILRGMNPNEPPQVQQLPLDVGLQRIGMTPEAFRAIQEAAEAKFHHEQEMQQQSQESQSQQMESSGSSEEDDSQEDIPAQLTQRLAAIARSLPVHAVHLPMPIVQQAVPQQEQGEPERPHFVQPRSVRSVNENPLREKRVKRCACNCAC